MSVASYPEDIELLSTVAREAGALAMKYFRCAPRTWAKGESSVVSEADLEVDRLLFKSLLAARPDYGWLSEETTEDVAQLGRKRVFVVDPIDGTRGFLAGEPEWTVSLAVVEDGRPVAAALFAPALETMFLATAGGGATRDGVPIRVSARSEIDGACLAGSRRLVRRVTERSPVSLAYHGFVPSLAYRIALVATGEVDIAVAWGGAYDWDLAAADLIVHESGGRLIDLEGGHLLYGTANRRHPPLVASTPGLSGAMTRLFKDAERERPH
jgi:myo-inositol-1(or 4)-monophosphatase